jgi:exosortase/archaeosortase family protein
MNTGSIPPSLRALPGRVGWKLPLFFFCAYAGPAWIDRLPDETVLGWFCRPAARVAGAILGTPVVLFERYGAPVWVLPHPVLDLHVGRECSGLHFFLLAGLLLLWNALGRSGRARLGLAAAAFPAAYLVALGTNALRLVAVFQMRVLTGAFLPLPAFGPVHTLTGAFVFLSSLILIHLAYETCFPTPPSPQKAAR